MDIIWHNHQRIIYALGLQTGATILFYIFYKLRWQMRSLPLLAVTLLIGNTLYQVGKVVATNHFLIPKKLCTPEDWQSMNLLWTACYAVVVYFLVLTAFLIADAVSSCIFMQGKTYITRKSLAGRIIHWMGLEITFHTTVLKISLIAFLVITSTVIFSVLFILGGIVTFLFFGKDPTRLIVLLWYRGRLGAWKTFRIRGARVIPAIPLALVASVWLIVRYSAWVKFHFEIFAIPLGLLLIAAAVKYFLQRRALKAAGLINPNFSWKMVKLFLIRPLWLLLRTLVRIVVWCWKVGKACSKSAASPPLILEGGDESDDCEPDPPVIINNVGEPNYLK